MKATPAVLVGIGGGILLLAGMIITAVSLLVARSDADNLASVLFGELVLGGFFLMIAMAIAKMMED